MSSWDVEDKFGNIQIRAYIPVECESCGVKISDMQSYWHIRRNSDNDEEELTSYALCNDCHDKRMATGNDINASNILNDHAIIAVRVSLREFVERIREHYEYQQA